MLAYGRVMPVSEIIIKLDAVDAAAVRRFGDRVMATARPSLAAVGPLKKLESYDTFASRFGAVSKAAE
jgi:hypothetical protein